MNWSGMTGDPYELARTTIPLTLLGEWCSHSDFKSAAYAIPPPGRREENSGKVSMRAGSKARDGEICEEWGLAEMILMIVLAAVARERMVSCEN
jgi:hypothetical protein